jgi:signal transduction histidine kinase
LHRRDHHDRHDLGVNLDDLRDVMDDLRDVMDDLRDVNLMGALSLKVDHFLDDLDVRFDRSFTLSHRGKDLYKEKQKGR